MKNFFILIFLMTLWLLMSGLYKTLIIFFGAVSVLLVTIVINRMSAEDGYELKLSFNLIKTMQYFAWLMLEVVKSNWVVLKILLSRQVKINQNFIEISAAQQDDLARVIFANSITLTPGTVTIETENKTFLVHTLNLTDSTKTDLNTMNERVAQIEK